MGFGQVFKPFSGTFILEILSFLSQLLACGPMTQKERPDISL